MFDPIDRQAALRLCIEGDGHDDERFTEGYNFAVCEIREGLKGLPTVETKPVQHGRWIQRRNGKYYCTNCGREERFIFQKEYCPRCGVSMR